MWLLLLASLAADGGVDGGADAGTPDAGIVEAVKPPAWTWLATDGGWLMDGGVTDILVLRVGETAQVQLPRPIVLMQCDEQLLTLGATLDTLLLTGATAGHTRCGFWYEKRAYPHRYFDVTVIK